MRDLWRQVDELHAALIPDYFRAAARAREDAQRLFASASAAVLVAEGQDGGRAGPGGVRANLVGAVTVRLFDTPDDPSMVPCRRAHVEALVVDQRHRRAGVGTRLMAAADAWARARGAVEMVLTVWSGNAAAEAFYQRLGYGALSRVLRRALAPT